MSDERPPGFEAPAFGPDYDERSAAADADVAAGRFVPNERVRQWLRSIIDGNAEAPPFSHCSSNSARLAVVGP